MAMHETLEGILLIDKAKGCTSFDVVAKVRRALGVRSVGHTGTLDPFATGLLIVLVGRYTRLCDYLTAQTKTYEARVRFGQSTTTDDLEGEILEQADPAGLTEEGVRAALQTFLGSQMQVPPQYSAISVGGERAYKKARRGEETKLAPRPVEIYDISLKHFAAPFADVVVHCSKGTYIRAIARDLGQKLDVPAHLTELRRLGSGDYDVNDALAQAELQGQAHSALRVGVSHIKGIHQIALDAAAAQMLGQGKQPTLLGLAPQTGVALAHLGEEPVALVRVEGQRLVSVRGFGI